MSGFLGRENEPGLYFTKATHWVALNRTRLIEKDGFLTNERVDISDKAFSMGQFLGNSHVRRSVTGGIDLGRGS